VSSKSKRVIAFHSIADKLLCIQLAQSGRSCCPPHNHVEKILVQIKGATAYKYMGRAVQMYAPIAHALDISENELF
jgi:hypothetical protein